MRMLNSAFGRLFVAAALQLPVWAALMIAAPAAAQTDEELQWFGDLTDGRAMLVYGVPESDYAPLSMMCDQGDQDLTIYLEYEPVKARVGDTVSVHMTAGGATATFPAVAEPQEMDDLLHLKGHAKLDATLQAILTAGGDLTLEIETTKITYPLKGAADAAKPLMATCTDKKAVSGEATTAQPAAVAGKDLVVKVTNKAKQALNSFSYSEAGVNSFDADTFGYEPLASGDSRTFIIPGGRAICTFDIAVQFVTQNDEDCCSMNVPAGTQNLCENSEFTVRDVTLAPAGDPWVGKWKGGGLTATIRRGTAKPDYLVIDLMTAAEGCSGAVTLYGKPTATSVLGESYDASDRTAPVCKVDIVLGKPGEMEATTAGDCVQYHGAACGFDGKLTQSR